MNSLRAYTGTVTKPLVRFAIIVAAFVVAHPASAPADTQVPSSVAGVDELQPDPRLSPTEVIRIQIKALGNKDVPSKNAGIEIAFRFASPANKSVTGPLARFIEMLNGPVYRPLLEHRQAHYGEVVVSGDKAVQPVVLTDRAGNKVGYLFSLSKQKRGRYASCWMTDSVIRFEIRGGKPESFPI